MNRLLRLLYAPDEGAGAGAAVADPPADTGDAGTEAAANATEAGSEATANAPESTSEAAPDTQGDATDGGEESTEQPGWLKSVKERYREPLQGHESQDSMIDEYLKLKESASNSIPKLAEDATDEDRARYREAMGIPDSPENYKLEHLERFKVQTTDNNGSEVEYEMSVLDLLGDDFDTWFSTTMFEAGAPQELAKSMHEAWQRRAVESLRTEAQSRRGARDKQRQAYIAEYGEAEADRRIDAGKSVLKFIDTGKGDLAAELSAANLLSSPFLLSAMVKLSKLVDPARLTTPRAGNQVGDNGRRPFNMSRSEAAAGRG